jgi:hypothetical protein
MKQLFIFISIFFSSFLSAQDISSHIPKRATYIVTINPAAHVGNGDMKEINNLELFTRNDEAGKSYLYGDKSLNEDRTKALSDFFRDIFSNPASTGIDTSKKIFIFNDTPDSIHYWAYVLPINNSTTFGDYVTTHLFSKKQTINKGSGFSAVNAERISIGWTNSYAILLLADYNYTYQSGDLFGLMAVQRLQDSLEAADRAQQEYQTQVDTVINDSIRMARTNQLMKDDAAMKEMLAKDTTPEEDILYGQYDDNNAYGSDWEAQTKRAEEQKDSVKSVSVFAQLRYLINLSYEESVQSLSDFRSVNAEVADGVYWYNYGEMMQQYYEKNMELRKTYYSYINIGADTSNIQNMWAGSYIVSIVHIQGNVAQMEQRSYFSKELAANTKGLYKGRVDKKMFRYVKGENLLGFVAMSVNMEKFMKFYGTVYRESLNNSLAGMYVTYYLAMWDLMRVFLDEKTMYHILNGKFLFAVTDLKPYTSSFVSYDYDENFNQSEVRKEQTKMRPEFIMVAGIGKEKKAEDIIKILEKANAIKKQNSFYYLINTPGEVDIKLFLSIQDGMLIITNNEDLMVNHLKHGYKKGECIKPNLKRLGRKSALVGWWDGQKTIELYKKNHPDSLSEEDKKALEVLQQNVNSGQIVGKKMKNGVQRIEVDLELSPAEAGTKQTGFVRFFRLLNSLYLVKTN